MLKIDVNKVGEGMRVREQALTLFVKLLKNKSSSVFYKGLKRQNLPVVVRFHK
jgi:hypothetical protein